MVPRHLADFGRVLDQAGADGNVVAVEVEDAGPSHQQVARPVPVEALARRDEIRLPSVEAQITLRCSLLVLRPKVVNSTSRCLAACAITAPSKPFILATAAVKFAIRQCAATGLYDFEQKYQRIAEGIVRRLDK